VIYEDRDCIDLGQDRNRWPALVNAAMEPQNAEGSAVTHLLELRVRIPPASLMSVSCECCVLIGRGLCVGLIPRSEESYRVWCVWV